MKASIERHENGTVTIVFDDGGRIGPLEIAIVYCTGQHKEVPRDAGMAPTYLDHAEAPFQLDPPYMGEVFPQEETIAPNVQRLVAESADGTQHRFLCGVCRHEIRRAVVLDPSDAEIKAALHRLVKMADWATMAPRSRKHLMLH